MDEAQGDAGRDLVDRGVVAEVLADPPVALADRCGRRSSRSRAPGAAGGTAPARTGRRARGRGPTSRDARSRTRRRARCARHRRTASNARGPARQRVGRASRVAGAAGAVRGPTRTCDGGGIDARSPRRRDPARWRATWPSPQPMSSTRRALAEMAGDQREDLVLVLGVGARRRTRAATTRRGVPRALRCACCPCVSRPDSANLRRTCDTPTSRAR